MNKKVLGLGLGLTLTALGVAALPPTAYADSTCYTGCSGPSGGVTTPVTPAPVSAPTVSAPVAPVQAPTSGALPFTGTDIEGMAAVGVGTVVAGCVMVRRSRRHRQARA